MKANTSSTEYYTNQDHLCAKISGRPRVSQKCAIKDFQNVFEKAIKKCQSNEKIREKAFVKDDKCTRDNCLKRKLK